ncbi:carbohydrate ABC transporter permease [Agromyces cerinus]|uniref:Carbohydrate ABC transporter membrane protein 1, CUT1 family n=1 Tax=Agromyces cerinus subsp. cerinus TaxID=232089 RepID=A0A1N6F7A5_9MICO|nr:sugar ABC transporter permease [Agromyces cerinus]SIN91130.1 carbohydrate ABC transporter membrane protein 1, CUT1 family [Agromyces cerinus subsp. cerinus]
MTVAHVHAQPPAGVSTETYATVATTGTASKGGRRRRARRDWAGWWFVGPFMLIFGLVFVAPLLYAMYLSLFRETLMGGNSFVGLENYAKAMVDPKFWEAMLRVSIFLLVQVPIMLGLALFAALALDSARLRWVPFYRLSIFLPYAVPGVVAVMIWGYMYGSQFGLVADINRFFGVELPSPLAENFILLSIGNIVTWEFVGYNMLIFFSALKAVPQDLYEAAEIDGAGTFRTIFSIKLPSIRGAMVIATIFSVIGSFQLFNEPSILQTIAPNSITTYFTPNLYAFNLSFAGSQFNYAAAIAIVSGVITMVVAYLVQLAGEKNETKS